MKRLRFIESPIAQQNTKVPLAKVLKGLSQAQLINVIQELVNNEPNIETKIRANLPMPDIKPMEEQLIQLKKNIFKSLPTSRLVKNTDAVAYSRAATHLAAFKKAIVDQSRQLNESGTKDNHFKRSIRMTFDLFLICRKLGRTTRLFFDRMENCSRHASLGQ